MPVVADVDLVQTFNLLFMYQGNKKYTNGEITVFWQPKKCTHVTTCYTELIEVFNPRKRPWINMEGAPTSEIIRVVRLCPTGALTFKYNAEIEAEAVTSKPGVPAENLPELRVMKDGPLVLEGSFRIIGTDGTELPPHKIVSLCRCGGSNDMPFCDGMHRKTGFTGK